MSPQITKKKQSPRVIDAKTDKLQKRKKAAMIIRENENYKQNSAAMKRSFYGLNKESVY